jgi:hypothetical protein
VPALAAGVRAVEHQARIEPAEHPVVHEHEEESDEERQPVLVEGQEDDDDEEVEVGLGRPAGELDHEGSAGEQPYRDDRGREPAPGAARRDHGEQQRRGHGGESVGEAATLEQRVDKDGHRVHREQAHQQAVAPAPGVVRERAPAREPPAQSGEHPRGGADWPGGRLRACGRRDRAVLLARTRVYDPIDGTRFELE